GTLDAVDRPQVTEEVDVDRCQVKRESCDRRLQLLQLLFGKLVSLNNDRPQPVGVHRAGGQPGRLQDCLYLLAFNRLIRVEETDGAAAADDLFELHSGPPSARISPL